MAATATVLASDAFNRTVDGGWGTADVGGAWSAAGTAYSVIPGGATIQADATSPANFLTAVSVQDVDVLTRISPPPAGPAYVDFGAAARYQAGTGAFYQVSAYYADSNNAGNYTVDLKRKPDNVQLNPEFQTAVPGGTPVWIRFEAQGVSPTALRWKLWPDGTPEPAGWTATGTDSTAGLQAGGGAGVEAYASTGLAGVSFNSFSATSISAPVPAVTCPSTAVACDTFNRSAGSGWGSADIGSAWSATGPAFGVTPGNATITADSSAPANFLSGVSVRDVDAVVKVSPPPMTSSYADVGVGVRYTASAGSFYQLSTYYASGDNGGNYVVELKRQPGDTPVNPNFPTTIRGGTSIWMRLQVQGTYPTTLRWKLWPDGIPEPDSWTATGSDANPAVQVAGGVGLKAYSGSQPETFVFNGLVVTALPSNPPAVFSCPIGAVDCDTFNRTVAGQWGTADLGGPWSTSGSGYSVAPGGGSVVADSTARSNFLTAAKTQDVDAVVRVTPPATSGAYVNTGLDVRYNAVDGSFYQLGGYYATGNNSGNDTVELKRQPANTAVGPSVNTAIPGGAPYWLHLQAQGINPTTLRWNIWQDGGTEPSGWTGTAIDNTPALQKPGGVGVTAYASAGTATVAVNALWATAMPPSCTSGAVACDTYARQASGGWGPADAGGQWSITGTPSKWGVSPGGGTINVAANAAELGTVLNGGAPAGQPVQDVELLQEVSLPLAAAGASDAFVVGRFVGGGTPTNYRVGVIQGTDQPNARIRVQKGDGTFIGTDTNTAIAAAGGLTVWLRVQIQGTNPTAIRARAWADGATEPTLWTVDTTDTTPAMQQAGAVGVRVRNEDTKAAHLYTYRAFQATTIPPRPVACTSAGSVACDAFSRRTSGGWAAADAGGSWSIAGTPASWSVSPGRGAISTAAGAAEIGTLLTSSSPPNQPVQDVELLQEVSVPLAAGGANSAAVVGRFVGGTTPTYYRVGVIQSSDQPTARIRVQRGDGTFIGADTSTGIAAGNGLTVWLRVQIQGTNPTAIRARAWQDGMAEPSLWTFGMTDSTPAMQVPGSVGIRVRNEDSGAGHLFTYRAFQAVRLAARPAVGAGIDVDDFSRTVSGSWGAATAGGSWDTSGPGYAVTSGRGTINATGSTPTNFLAGNAIANVDVLAWVSPPSISSAYIDAGVAARYDATGGNFYQLSAYYAAGNNGGNYTVQLKRKLSNTAINPDVNTSIPGGTAIWLRLQAEGTSPTTLRWKVWQDGTPEPAGWAGSATDSTPAMQPAGGAGVEAYANFGTPAVSFNSFVAKTIGG